MKKVLAVEPVAPMSEIDVEFDIIAQCGERILTKNWKGQFIQLSPTTIKNNKIIYRIEDSSLNLSDLNFNWEGETECLSNLKKKNK